MHSTLDYYTSEFSEFALMRFGFEYPIAINVGYTPNEPEPYSAEVWVGDCDYYATSIIDPSFALAKCFHMFRAENLECDV